MKQQVIIFLLSALAVVSCHKSERDNDTDVSAVEDMGKYFTLENDVWRQMHYYCDSLSDVNKIAASCVTVSVSGTNFPKTITLDFGSANCAGADGNMRRGKIIAVFTDRYRDSASSVTISTNNFYLNDHKIDASKIITNLGKNSSGHIRYDVVSNIKAELSTSKTFSFDSHWVREWVSGDTTQGNFTDDVYSVTGSGSGTGTRGNTIKFNITSALKISQGCPWVTEGTLNVTPANLAVRTFNFGSGTCDNKAAANVNGQEVEITLP